MQLDINNDQHFLCRGSTLSLQRFNTFCESLVLFIISSFLFTVILSKSCTVHHQFNFISL
jgi:hypothetical protein